MIKICGFEITKFKNLCTVWKLRKFTLTLFWQKFRESNSFTNKENTIHLIWRIFSRETKFLLWKLLKFTILSHFWQIFRESNDLLKKLLKSWFDEIFIFPYISARAYHNAHDHEALLKFSFSRKCSVCWKWFHENFSQMTYCVNVSKWYVPT